MPDSAAVIPDPIRDPVPRHHGLRVKPAMTRQARNDEQARNDKAGPQ